MLSIQAAPASLLRAIRVEPAPMLPNDARFAASTAAPRMDRDPAGFASLLRQSQAPTPSAPAPMGTSAPAPAPAARPPVPTPAAQPPSRAPTVAARAAPAAPMTTPPPSAHTAAPHAARQGEARAIAKVAARGAKPCADTAVDRAAEPAGAPASDATPDPAGAAGAGLATPGIASLSSATEPCTATPCVSVAATLPGHPDGAAAPGDAGAEAHTAASNGAAPAIGSDAGHATPVALHAGIDPSGAAPAPPDAQSDTVAHAAPFAAAPFAAGPFAAALGEARAADAAPTRSDPIIAGAADAAPASAAAFSAPPSIAPHGAAVAIAIATPLAAASFPQALGLHLSVLVRDGVQQAELHLNPAEMGPVSVQIVMDGTQAHVHFGADVAATRQTLEAGLPALASSLREAGFTLAGGGVSEHARGRNEHGDAGGHGSGGSGDERAARGTSGDPAARTAPAPARHVRLGGVDLYA